MSSERHDCEWVEAVLLGEAPAPTRHLASFEAGIDGCPSCSALASSLADIDTLAGDLPELVVPAELSKQTLQAVLDELTAAPEVGSSSSASRKGPARRWPLALIAGGLSVAAAAMLTVWPTGPSPAPPERLVARGNATSLPAVSLKVAVDDGTGLMRHRRGETYPAGTRIQFRVGLDQAADVALVRIDGSGSEVVARSSLQGGEHDLQLGSTPLAWEVEPGERDAHFVVLAGPSGSLPEDPRQVVPAGAGTVDDTGVCAQVTALSCDERHFQVSP